MIKKSLKTLLTFPLRVFRRWTARREMAKLVSHESPKLKAVGNALREAFSNVISVEERMVISSIEQRRAFLLSSDDRIAVVDYGAGRSDSKRTKEEMKKGVQTTESVSKICEFSKPAFWATLLFKLIRKLEPSSCVELGTCVGISASYQAAALAITQKGKLLSLEGSPEIARIARETFASLDLRNASVITGPFQETFRGVLEAAKPVDFLFNDGHHDHDAVLRYFNEALPYLSDDAIIVFDDISWSPGMRKAWTEIENDERVAASIDIQVIGIAFVSKKLRPAKEKYKIPL